MSRHFAFFSFFSMRGNVLCLLLILLCCLCDAGVRAQVTLLVPSQPSVEAPPVKALPPQREGKRAGLASAEGKTEGRSSAESGAAAPSEETSAEAPALDAEVDVLISMMHPFRSEGVPLDMPQLFAVLRYDEATPQKDGVWQPERRDLLGDVQEIRYMNCKAWGANVALTRPGLYQFLIEGRPWWDAAQGCFLRHYVKTVLPVYGVERGWHLPVGHRVEILPRTRPFGLMAPALFAGTAILDGKPLAAAPVRMLRINMEKHTVPTPWHEALVAITGAQGEFAFVLNQPGWWVCLAEANGDPLKGPDGQAKPVIMGALFWLYVDGSAGTTRKR